MIELHHIRIDRHMPGRGSDATVKDFCMFSTSRNGCELDSSIDCYFGLTAITVPKLCPLKTGHATLWVKLEREEREE